MDYLKLKTFLNDFSKHLKIINSDIQMIYSEPYHIKTQWNESIPFCDNNGIYLYVTKDNEILYIGKGEQKNGGGIGNRSWSHLGRHIKDVKMFPYHQWINDNNIEASIRNIITEGDFFLYTVKINPEYFSSLVEKYALTLVKDNLRHLPPLNTDL